jgi:hypothetical protein
MSVKLLFVALLLCFCALSQARPLWGVTGHALIASIAQTLLSTESTQKALTLLPANQGQLSQIASWADQIKDESQWSWSAPLHYINTPNWECAYNPLTDCPNQVCVAGAIFNYTNQLANPGSATFNATQDALKFVVHFVGDIHQPLHVAFASDRGGNTIDGTYFNSKDDLHEIWDTYLINTRMSQDFSGSQSEYLKYLITAMNTTYQADSEVWSVCNNTKTSPYACPDEWASETADKACLFAYTDQNGNHIQNGFSLGQAYFDFAQNTLDQQLIKGGIRLARTLNNIWGSN